MTPKKAVAVAGAQLPGEKGNCVLCAVAAERACQRCGDFYCSKDCQLQDWQRHRYICFPLPALVYPKSFSVHSSPSTEELKLEGACFSGKADKAVVESNRPSPLPRIIPESKCDEPISEVGTTSSNARAGAAPKSEVGTTSSNARAGAAPKTVPVAAAPAPIPHASNSIVSNNNTSNPRTKNISPPKASVPPSNSIVFISGFRSPNRCYIRDASETADKAFSQMCQKVNAMGNEMPRMVKPRTYGYCLARYNGMFQRASVMTVMGHHSARLLLFDQGIVKSRSISEMREINDELLSLPCFSVQVQLKDVPNYAITEDVIEFLSQFEGEKFVAVYTKAPGAINVELLYPETKESLNARICSFCANKKVFETAYAANKNKNEKEAPKQPNPPAALGSNKPNPSQGTASVNSQKNNTPTEMGREIEEGRGSSITIQDDEFAKIEEEEKLYETKDLTKADPHVQTDVKTADPAEKKLDCSQGSGGASENAKATPTAGIENVNLSHEPKAIEVLDKDKNISAPQTVFKTKDEQVKEFLTQCLASKPNSDTKTEKAPESVAPEFKEQLDVQSSLSESKPKTNGIADAVLVPPFEMRRFSIPSREGIDVFVVDVSKIARGIFGAFDSSSAYEFSTLHTRLSEITDSEPYKPTLKEFVLARYEGSWYRGRVEQVKVTPDKTEYRVMYLDYTNAADITEQDIRRYPLDFTTPCTTNICMIEGFPHKPSSAQVAYLSETVKVHQLLHVDGVMYLNVQSDIAIVKSRALISKLMSL